MRLSLGFSPCPNDTFIFDAMVHHKIDTLGLEFEKVMLDVEELNRKAFAEELSITKISFHAFAHLTGPYQLLDAGSALGEQVGPLLIAKELIPHSAIDDAKIAIPGKYTTANFLLSLAYPNARQKEIMLFSEIENAVLNGEVDAGLIIHENRFTYQQKGLIKLMDLGEFWEQTTQMPIPLGGIIVKRNLPEELKQKINQVMRESVAFAFTHPDSSEAFVKKHAQEMNPHVIQQHINLYVNDYTKDLGSRGKAAVYKMMDMAREKKIISDIQDDIFIG